MDNVRKQQGFILITVLLLIVLIAAALLEFNYQSRQDLRSTDAFYRRVQARHAARAGIELTRALLSQYPEYRDQEGLCRLFNQETILPVAASQCRILVSQEGGKININKLKTNDQLERQRIDQLLLLIDVLNQKLPSPRRLEYGLVPALIDWTDADDQITQLAFVSHANRGAETEYYRRQVPAYPCANQPLDRIDQLLLVRDITPRLLYHLTEGTPETAETGLADYLTVYGDGKININYAPLPVLRSLCLSITEGLARQIVQYRAIRPFASVGEIRQVPGMTEEIFTAIQEYITVTSAEPCYRVTVTAQAENTSCKVTAILKQNHSARRLEMVYYQEI